MKTKYLNTLIISSFVILVLSSFSCSKTKFENVKIGTYATVYPSKFSIMYDKYINNTGSSIGDTIVIIDNINFTYRICGDFKYGKYIIKNDSLILNIDSTYVFGKKLMNYSKYSHSLSIEDSKTLKMTFKVKYSKDSKKLYNSKSVFHYIEENE